MFYSPHKHFCLTLETSSDGRLSGSYGGQLDYDPDYRCGVGGVEVGVGDSLWRACLLAGST